MSADTAKTRILFILHMPPPVHGAAMMGQYIHDSELINSEFDCHFINYTTAQSLADVGKLDVNKFEGFKHLLSTIKEEVRNFQPEYIYITPNSAGKAFYKDFITVQFCKHISNAHIILHFHNKGVKSRENHIIDNLLYRKFFKNTKVILIANPLLEDVKKYVSSKDCYICYNGIPTISHTYSKKENKVPHILWLTNMMKTKGLIEFIDALKILKDKGIDFKTDFVGGITPEITLNEIQEKVKENGLSDCAEYHGEKYGDEKLRFWQFADIFVLPSYTEAFPLSILEAMQYGIPVVATNVGGVSDVIENGKNGLLIGGDKPIIDHSLSPDPKELANAIEFLILNPHKRKSMGENSKRKYQEFFNLDVFYEQFFLTLKTIIKDFNNVQ